MVEHRVYFVSLSAPTPPLRTDVMHSHFLANPPSPLCHQKSDKHNFFVNPPPLPSPHDVIKGQPLKGQEGWGSPQG